MPEPGDRRPHDADRGTLPATSSRPIDRAPQPRSRVQAVGLAILVVLLAAAGWAFLRGILELSVGMVAVAFVGGWGIGAAVRLANAAAVVALALAASAWLLGLVFTWLLALAILPGSSRTFFERVEGTPFIEWLGPQFGILEIVGLIVYLATAGYAYLRGSTPSAVS